MEFKYIVVYQPENPILNGLIDDIPKNHQKNKTEEISMNAHAEFYNSLREIGNNFGIDHTTVSKRLSKNPNTFLPKKGIWIIKLS